MATSALASTDIVVHDVEASRVAAAREDARLALTPGEEALPLDPEEMPRTSPNMASSFIAARHRYVSQRASTGVGASASGTSLVEPCPAKPRAVIVSEVLSTMKRYLTGESANDGRKRGKHSSGHSSKAKKDLFRHVLGIVNPGSGENAASSMVAESMRHSLGRHRVLLLNRDVFADPSGLRQLLKRYAVVYFSPINGRNMDDILQEEAQQQRERSARRRRAGKRRKARGGASSCGSSVSSRSSSSSSSSSSAAEGHHHAGAAPAPRGRARRRAHAIPDKVDTAEMRGTVFVSGGDGTMAFILDQVEKVRQELQTELCLHSLHELTSVAGATKRLFATPAVAPIPLGTGNDFSNCLGFGSGFTKRRQGVAGWLCCANTDVGQLLEQAAAAPAVPFDRWRASFVPLRVAQQHYHDDRGEGRRPVSSSADVDVPAHQRRGSASGDEPLISHLVPVPSVGDELLENAPDASPAGAANGSSMNGSPPGMLLRSSRKRMVSGAGYGSQAFSASYAGGGGGALANQVHGVDWVTVQSNPHLCKTYGIINYLGIGFDAYVTCKFDETRKKYPQLCSTRVQNKAVYGFMGLRGSIKCKSTRKLLPMVCIPRPSTTLHATVGVPANAAGGAQATPSSKPDMVALSIPDMTKALVMTNVNSYSAGAHPWDALDPEVFYEPIVGIRDTNLLTAMPGRPRPVPAGSPLSGSLFGTSFGGATAASASQASTASRNGTRGADTVAVTGAEVEELPVVTPVAVNDRRFELQAMGGVLHYGAMGAGLTSAVKMAQPSEMFIFVLCTPDDLPLPEGSTSLFTQTRLKGYEARIRDDLNVQASLYVQVDGEALPRIEEPMIIHIEPIATERVYVRCLNTDVVWQKNPVYRALVEEAIDEQMED